MNEPLNLPTDAAGQVHGRCRRIEPGPYTQRLSIQQLAIASDASNFRVCTSSAAHNLLLRLIGAADNAAISEVDLPQPTPTQPRFRDTRSVSHAPVYATHKMNPAAEIVLQSDTGRPPRKSS